MSVASLDAGTKEVPLKTWLTEAAVLRYFSSSAMTNKSLRERLKLPESRRSKVTVLIRQALDRGLIKPADPESTSRTYAEYVPAWA